MSLGEEYLMVSKQIRNDDKLKVRSKIMLAGDELQTFAAIAMVAA